MKKHRKIIPIKEAAKARNQLHRFGITPEEEAQLRARPPGELPFMIRARFSPFVPALLIVLGALFLATGIIDGIGMVWIPGGVVFGIGIAWFLRQRQLYRFALRSGGSSPQKPDKTNPPDDYNDSIVTRG